MVTSQQLQQQQSSAQSQARQDFMSKLRSVGSQEQQRQLKLQYQRSVSGIESAYLPAIEEAQRIENTPVVQAQTPTNTLEQRKKAARAEVEYIIKKSQAKNGYGVISARSAKEAGDVYASYGLDANEGSAIYAKGAKSIPYQKSQVVVSPSDKLPQSSLSNLTPSAAQGQTNESVALESARLNAERQAALIKSQDIQGFSGTSLSQQQLAKKQLLENIKVIPRTESFGEFVKPLTAKGEQFIVATNPPQDIKTTLAPISYAPTPTRERLEIGYASSAEPIVTMLATGGTGIAKGILGGTARSILIGTGVAFNKPLTEVGRRVTDIFPQQNGGIFGTPEQNVLSVGRGAITFGLASNPVGAAAYGTDFLTNIVDNPVGTVKGALQYAKANPFEVATPIILGTTKSYATAKQTAQEKLASAEKSSQATRFRTTATSAEKSRILSKLNDDTLMKYQEADSNLKQVRIYTKDVQVSGEKLPRKIVLVESAELKGIGERTGQRTVLGYQLIADSRGNYINAGRSFSVLLEKNQVAQGINKLSQIISDTTFESPTGSFRTLSSGGGKIKLFTQSGVEDIKNKGSASGFGTGKVVPVTIDINGVKIKANLPQRVTFITDTGESITSPLKQVLRGATQSEKKAILGELIVNRDSQIGNVRTYPVGEIFPNQLEFSTKKAALLFNDGKESSATSVRAVVPQKINILGRFSSNSASLAKGVVTKEVGDIVIGREPSNFADTFSKSMKPFDVVAEGKVLKTIAEKTGQGSVQVLKRVSKQSPPAAATGTLTMIGQGLVQSTITPQAEFTPVSLVGFSRPTQQAVLSRNVQDTVSVTRNVPVQDSQFKQILSTPTAQTSSKIPNLFSSTPSRVKTATTTLVSTPTQQQQAQISIPKLANQLGTSTRQTSPRPNPNTGGSTALAPPTSTDEGLGRMLALSRKAIASESFKVQVSKGGKFKTIATGLPKGRALKLGSDVTSSTLASQFRIVKEGETTLGDINFKPSSKVFRTFKIVKGKSIPLPQGSEVYQFIERKNQRLKSSGELSQIEVFKQRGFKKAKQMKLFGKSRKGGFGF